MSLGLGIAIVVVLMVMAEVANLLLNLWMYRLGQREREKDDAPRYPWSDRTGT